MVIFQNILCWNMGGFPQDSPLTGARGSRERNRTRKKQKMSKCGWWGLGLVLPSCGKIPFTFSTTHFYLTKTEQSKPKFQALDWSEIKMLEIGDLASEQKIAEQLNQKWLMEKLFILFFLSIFTFVHTVFFIFLVPSFSTHPLSLTVC